MAHKLKKAPTSTSRERRFCGSDALNVGTLGCFFAMKAVPCTKLQIKGELLPKKIPRLHGGDEVI